jgi:hypothetical protein
MKKLIVIIALILFCTGIQAMAGGKTVSYVKAGGKVYFGKNIKVGLFNTKVIDAEGTITKVPNRSVEAYMHNSKLYEYLPVICEDNDTTCFAMMEYITGRSGLKLYRYNCYTEKETRYEYFVFKDNKFYLRIDQSNAVSVLPFFGVEVL